MESEYYCKKMEILEIQKNSSKSINKNSLNKKTDKEEKEEN